MPKFSIITPTWDRMDYQKLPRCIRSVQGQTFTDYEHIVVDDGSSSKDGTEVYVRGVAEKDERIKYIKVPHRGRIIARNIGVRAALESNNGPQSWYCHLDSDDVYDAEYLNTFAYHIGQTPEARLWVCGSIIHGVLREGKKYFCPIWTKIRKAWMPPPPVEENEIHGHFPSGTVGTGQFVFHSECLEKTGIMPDWIHHLAIADGVNDWLGYTTQYSAAKKWLGNPYGDDYALFRKLTMFYQVHLIEAALYVQYQR